MAGKNNETYALRLAINNNGCLVGMDVSQRRDMPTDESSTKSQRNQFDPLSQKMTPYNPTNDGLVMLTFPYIMFNFWIQL